MLFSHGIKSKDYIDKLYTEFTDGNWDDGAGTDIERGYGLFGSMPPEMRDTFDAVVASKNPNGLANFVETAFDNDADATAFLEYLKYTGQYSWFFDTF